MGVLTQMAVPQFDILIYSFFIILCFPVSIIYYY